jgi:16S rRNA (guanine1207-N2)-methyltransferase
MTPVSAMPVAAPTDPVDRILLHEAGQLSGAPPARVVVVDDVTGQLAVAVVGLLSQQGAAGAVVRVHCDSLRDEQRVQQAAETAGVDLELHPVLDADLLAGADWVVLRLPKSLAALDEVAEVTAQAAAAGVRLLAGGRVKHMTRGMNRVLLQHFHGVTASLGQQKSRVLLASGPRVSTGPASDSPCPPSTYPRCERDPELDLVVCAHGGAFAGAAIDHGTRFLASFFSALPAGATQVVDLGCGTGVLAALVARQQPEAEVLAVDDSAAACRSAESTLQANGVGNRARVARSDVLDGVADASVDLVVCNPPFHRGTTRDSDAAFRMFAESRRVLRPGGELWTVFNAHLPYLNALRRTVGSTRVMGQNPQFLVTRSVAPG